MNKEELLSRFTKEDVTDILVSFGSSPPICDNNGNLLFDTNVAHGGDSQHKLCYFEQTHSFYCYTRSYATNLIDLVMFNLNLSFNQAMEWLGRYKGITNGYQQKGFVSERIVNEDLEFFASLKTTERKSVDLTIYDDSVLTIFNDLYPASWKEDGISEDVAERFDLKYCFIRNACIIPYRDEKGRLIGIRQRNFDEEQILAGRKYIPAVVQKTTYAYPSSQVLYGIYEHQEAIRESQKVVLFEGEKSVMLHSSYYQNSNALALGGGHLSKNQRQLLIDLNVKEVVLCLDKDFDETKIDDKESRDYQIFIAFVKKLKKMVRLLSPYFTVSVIFCFDDSLLPHDSPIDRGKSVYERLYQERHVVLSEEELDVLLD